MTRKSLVSLLALTCVVALFASACGGSDDGDSKASGSSTTAATTEQAKGLLPDNGPCDTAKPAYPVGIITTFKSPVISLGDQVSGLEASVKAFNKRGGVGGHCMDLTTCDSKADPNKEADCARRFVDKGIVATLNDTTAFNPTALKELFEPAGISRIAISPSFQELSSKVSYPIGAGGTGTTFMMVPGCTRNGHKKIAAIHFDTPQMAPLFAALGAMLKAYGAEMVKTIPVPAGTTDFQQFTLAAEKAGATCAIIPLGTSEAVQVLQAAKQLGSKMTFSASFGSFGTSDLKAFGDFAKQIYLNAEIPPITADQKSWPILKEAIADLSASGAPELQPDRVKSSTFASWIATYAFVKIVQDFGTPDTITREAVSAAVQKAKDVDMFGLIPPWTPSASIAGPGPFSAISQPWYYVATFDGGKFKIQPDQYNVLAELRGTIEYPQPGASGAPTPTTGG